MAIKTYRPTTQTLRYRTTLVNDDITTKKPHKPLVEPKTAHRRTAQFRQYHHVVSWRREQAQTAPDRFQARQARHSGDRGFDRIRSEPFGAHRAAELCGWREALHPSAGWIEGWTERLSVVPMPTFWSAMRCRCATFRPARPSTTSSCGPARARRWCARRAVRRSWSRKKATTRW